MNKLIIVLLLFYTVFCVAQIVPSSCTTTNDSLKNYHIDDAYYLAISYDRGAPTNYKDSAYINKELANHYLECLLAINNSHLPQADTVNTIYQIHHIDNIGLKGMIINIDTFILPNTSIYRNNQLITGYLKLDSILQFYSFDSSSYFISLTGANKLYLLYTDSFINGWEIGKRVMTISGINSCIAYPYKAFDNNRISDSVTSNFTDICYERRWKNCLDGCDSIEPWRFRVYKDCSVEFLGHIRLNPTWYWGINSVIEPLNKEHALELYPNPTSNLLSIQSEAAYESYSIFDILGNSIIDRAQLNLSKDVDISFLTKGTYIIQLQNKETVISKRFFKD